MIALLVYLFIALGFSFLCSVAEAVLLSVSTAYVRLLEQEKPKVAALLQQQKKDVDVPLAAILSLNTIAHTVGAAGVGAQAAAVFGNHILGVASAILTLLILVFSEIIPKTLGSFYWRQLAPSLALFLKYLVRVLYPLVWLSKWITRGIAHKPTTQGFSRAEFAAMAELGQEEGELAPQEAQILNNLFKLSDLRVEDVLTPSPVMFRLPEDSTVDVYFNKYKDSRFSRIPLCSANPDEIKGFALRSDLLLAKARGNADNPLQNYRRDLQGVLDKLSLLACFELFVAQNAQMFYVVDEYGSLKGLITQEDIFETLMGMEIIDESDRAHDMRQFARQQWRKRAKAMGLEIDQF